MLSEDEAHRLLNDLCAKLGFCLPPDAVLELASGPPDSPQSFADEVFRAEGLDPATADLRVYRQVRDMAKSAFVRSEGNIR